MFCSSLRFATAILLIALAAGCRRAEPASQRLAILRFENLTGDPSLDWMGRAYVEILESQLSASPGLQVVPSNTIRGLERALGPHPRGTPGISAERPQAILIGATRIVYGTFTGATTIPSRDRQGADIRASISVEDPSTGRIVKTASAAGPDIFAQADSLARQLGGNIRPYGTRSRAALEAYCRALDSSDAAAAAGGLERAVATDPNYGAAYITWAGLEMDRRDRGAAERVLERAARASLAETDRARLAYMSAVLRNDAAGQERALSALVRLYPSDSAAYRSLAEHATRTRRFPQAAAYLRKAAELSPNDVALWNILGYVEGYAQNLDGALAALRRYEQLRPNEANPLDSIGDVNFYAGRFAEAEKYYLAADRRSPGFLGGGPLLKASQARLMTGDIAGADGLFARYIEHRKRAQDNLLEYWQAQWQFLTGKRLEAVARLEAFVRKLESMPAAPVAARAHAQISVWALVLGDRARARQHAQAAASLTGKSMPDFAAVALFLTEPETSGTEWAVRAERAFQPGPLKDFALAYAWLFGKHFDRAAPLLKQLYDGADPTREEGLPILLAWSYIETGRAQDAVPLLRVNPPPQATGFGVFLSLQFPRVFFLRKEYELFLKLSGPTPTIWGEEQRARQALK